MQVVAAEMEICMAEQAEMVAAVLAGLKRMVRAMELPELLTQAAVVVVAVAVAAAHPADQVLLLLNIKALQNG
jgi:hypothetical protein